MEGNLIYKILKHTSKNANVFSFVLKYKLTYII